MGEAGEERQRWRCRQCGAVKTRDQCATRFGQLELHPPKPAKEESDG